MLDTSIHFVVEGVAVRVPDVCGEHELRAICAAVHEAESQRTERRRYRAVPIYRGETRRVLEWVDVFGERS